MQGGESIKRDMKRETGDARHETEATAKAEPRVLDFESPHSVVLTFGVFDGVHVAHQIVIGHVVNRAKALDTDGIVISFDPHPALSISGVAPPALTTATKKIELLEALGVKKVVVEDFNERFARLSPEEFVRDVLVGRFHAREIVVGYDCAFGKDRAGDKQLLKKWGEKYGFIVDVVEPYRLDGDVVSSTRIRTAISRADLDLVRRLLDRLYSISGLVVPGKGMGRRIGYATANLQLQEQALPPRGVYAVQVRLAEQRFSGILNMGSQPTFGVNDFRVEVHLLDFDGDLYGQNVEIFFVKKIRDEKAFAGLEGLANQIRKDEAVARKILSAMDSGADHS